MTHRVFYEWAVEQLVDDCDDIEDVRHWDTFKQAFADHNTTSERSRIVLVRDVRHREDLGDLLDRQWCYLNDDGTLPTAFDGGADVPQPFLKEVFDNDD